MTQTVLKLGALSFPVGSDRGITQSLTFISNGELRRTVNGDLVDTTRAANRKFQSSVSCDDMDSPTLAGIWRGQELTVECIAIFNQQVTPAAVSAILIRDAVESSIVGVKADGTKLDPIDYDDLTREVEFAEAVAFVRFRPILQMMVVNVNTDEDEFAAEVSWSVDLEEV